MGTYSRPITGTTAAGTGATYIMLDRTMEKIAISITVNGTVTDYDVDTTTDQIQFGGLPSNNAQFVNNTDRVAPASANWSVTSLNAESANGSVLLAHPFTALRILINAGAGSLSYSILQSG